MKLLALDPAAATGFAWQDTASPNFPLYGVWQLTGGKGEHPGQRLERLRRYIYDMQRAFGIDRIAYEDASFGSHNPSTQALHNQLAGVILLVASELNIPAVPVNPASLKKFATGNGRAVKAQMIRACETMLSIRTEDNNIADALWVLEWAKQHPNATAVKARSARRRPRRTKVPRLF